MPQSRRQQRELLKRTMFPASATGTRFRREAKQPSESWWASAHTETREAFMEKAKAAAERRKLFETTIPDARVVGMYRGKI